MVKYRVQLEIIGDTCVEVDAPNEREAIRQAKMQADLDSFEFGPRTIESVEVINDDEE